MRAAQEFFEKNYEQLFLIAYRITGDRDSAKEIVHETYIHVASHWGKIDFPWGYISVSVVRRATQTAKRRRRLLDLLAGRFTAAARLPSPSPEHVAELRDDARAVRRALSRMTPRQRAIAVLHYYLEYTPAEIADELHTSRQNVNTQLRRIKAKLATILQIPHDAPLQLSGKEETGMSKKRTTSSNVDRQIDAALARADSYVLATELQMSPEQIQAELIAAPSHEQTSSSRRRSRRAAFSPAIAVAYLVASGGVGMIIADVANLRILSVLAGWAAVASLGIASLTGATLSTWVLASAARTARLTRIISALRSRDASARRTTVPAQSDEAPTR